MFSFKGLEKRVGLASFAIVLCLPLLGACTRSRATAGDEAAIRLAAANHRLQGSWTLMRFQPEVSLEPMLAQLLALQAGRLTVAFQNGRATITGVGVATERGYRIDEAVLDHLRLTVIDDSGVTYQCTGDFVGNEFRFHSDTSPWQGVGVLVRSGP
jgi:hypothetical protein